MKIHKPIGSKDRFLEMFQGVNKVRLNENIVDASRENGNLAKSAFDELVNGNLKIQETNSQSNNNESFVEIVGADNGGNVATFKFRVTSSQGDQDGVLSVDSATLINFKIKTHSFDGEMPEGENTIKQLNAERGQEMIDVVSEYVDDNSGAPEDTELYEDAVNLIDKIPYNKGTEDMQTNAAYADQKPTNPDVRVQSDELQKFISEIQDYGSDEVQGNEPAFRMPDFDEPELEPEDMSQPVETLTPEKESIIMQAYENLVAKNGVRNPRYAPTTPEIMAEIDRMEGKVPAPKMRTFPKEAEPFLESSIVPDVDAGNVVTKGYHNLLSTDTKNQIISTAMEYLDMQLGVKKFQMPKEMYVKMVKDLAIVIYQRGASAMNEEDEKGDYPDQMGKTFKTKSKYPKKKKKIQTTVRIGEGEEEKPEDENDGMSLEPQGDEVEQIAQDKEEAGEELEGGLADGKSPSEFDPEQILKGMKVELEHTDDPMKAVEIAMDHLAELPDYYDHLERMEADAEKNGAGSTDPMNPSGCLPMSVLPSMPSDDDGEMTDVLLGYEPKNVGDEVEEPQVQEEIGMEDYQGAMGDKYADAEGNEFAVSNKVKGGVSLRGQGGEKEVATGDLTLMKKLNESEEAKPLITEEQIKTARRTLSKSRVSTGMTKKEAVAILIKNNLK